MYLHLLKCLLYAICFAMQRKSCKVKDKGCNAISVVQGCQSQQIKTWDVTLKLLFKFNVIFFFILEIFIGG